MIEAILVMGIAGLIFLLVFIALPTLQRTQRDSTRKENIETMIKRMKTYQDNHRGALPDTPDGGVSGVTANSANAWGEFYRNSLGSNFVDPDGTPYVLEVSKCNGPVADAECDEDYSSSALGEFPNDHKIYIVEQAKCGGTENIGAVATSRLRNFAVVYKLEGGGIFCAEG